MTLKCPIGYKIKIIEAFYKRPNRGGDGDWYCREVRDYDIEKCCEDWKDHSTNCEVSIEEHFPGLYEIIIQRCSNVSECHGFLPVADLYSMCKSSCHYSSFYCKSRRVKIKYYCYTDASFCASTVSATTQPIPETPTQEMVSTTLQNEVTDTMQNNTSDGARQSDTSGQRGEGEFTHAPYSLGMVVGITAPVSLILGAAIMFVIMRLVMKRSKENSTKEVSNSTEQRFTSAPVNSSSQYNLNENPYYEGEGDVATTTIDRSTEDTSEIQSPVVSNIEFTENTYYERESNGLSSDKPNNTKDTTDGNYVYTYGHFKLEGRQREPKQ